MFRKLNEELAGWGVEEEHPQAASCDTLKASPCFYLACTGQPLLRALAVAGRPAMRLPNQVPSNCT